MRKNKGFLLLEVMVTVAIVAGALLFVTRVYSTASQITKRSGILFEYGLLLEKAMFEFEERLAIREQEKESEFDYPKGYYWKVSAVPVIKKDPNVNLDMNEVKMDVSGGREPSAERHSLMTYLKNLQ